MSKVWDDFDVSSKCKQTKQMAQERTDINKIVKEQVELIKTEEIIKKILERINSQINQLCVRYDDFVVRRLYAK